MGHLVLHLERVPIRSNHLSGVMPRLSTLVAGIHISLAPLQLNRRGWPARARPSLRRSGLTWPQRARATHTLPFPCDSTFDLQKVADDCADRTTQERQDIRSHPR